MPVYKDEQRKTWMVKLKYKDWQGNAKWRTKRGFATKREAQQWETDFLATRQKDLTMTLSAFVDLYLEELRPRLKVSTMRTKEANLFRWVVPYLGKKNMCDIDSADIVKWQNMLLQYKDPKTGKVFSKNYLRNLNAQLHALFRYAQKHYKLKEHPMEVLDNIGSKNEGKMDFWTLEEYTAFSEECMEDPLAYYCFETLYWTGIREGEMLALQPKDFDFDAKNVSITKTYHCIKGKDVYTSPKTKAGNRVVDLPEKLCNELQDYLRQNYEMAPTDRMFPVQKDFLYGRMKKFAEKAGVKRIRIHDLRHSHVSLLIHLGFNALEIGERIGHESAAITYHYAHLFPDPERRLAKSLDQMMGGDA